MNKRNRIVGGIAIALGIVVVATLVIDGRWEKHDTVKPIKALLGGLVFIGLGAWYLLRGDKAESWRDKGNALPLQNNREDSSKPMFQAQRQKARQLERSPDDKS